ncbi:MAG: Cdc6/Cdc18 family protein [Halodesulfurarchaeum sp.]
MISPTKRGAIFDNTQVFAEDWVPGDFECRDSQLNLMASALEPIIHDGYANGLLLYGPSGTGKTSSSRYLLGKLREHSFELETAHVNCWSDYTRYRILHRIVDELPTENAHRHSRSAGTLRDTLHDYEPPIVVLLDEADQIGEIEIFYDLYELPNLEVIVTANDPHEVYVGLEDRIRSRMTSLQEVKFDPYSVDELESILDQRVKHGLQPGVISTELVRKIADEAEGNARDAITALKSSAQLAVEDRADEIQDEHVEQAMSMVSENIRQQALERLNKHQQTLFELVRDNREIAPRDLYQKYESQVDDPRSERTVRKYLRKLEQYDLVTSNGSSQTKRYHVA